MPDLSAGPLVELRPRRRVLRSKLPLEINSLILTLLCEDCYDEHLIIPPVSPDPYLHRLARRYPIQEFTRRMLRYALISRASYAIVIPIFYRTVTFLSFDDTKHFLGPLTGPLSQSISSSKHARYVRHLDFTLVDEDGRQNARVLAICGEVLDVCCELRSVTLDHILRQDSWDEVGIMLKKLNHQTLIKLSIGGASRIPTALIRVLANLPALANLSLQGYTTRDASVWTTLIKVWTMDSQLPSQFTGAPGHGLRCLSLSETICPCDFLQLLPPSCPNLEIFSFVNLYTSLPGSVNYATFASSFGPSLRSLELQFTPAASTGNFDFLLRDQPQLEALSILALTITLDFFAFCTPSLVKVDLVDYEKNPAISNRALFPLLPLHAAAFKAAGFNWTPTTSQLERNLTLSRLITTAEQSHAAEQARILALAEQIERDAQLASRRQQEKQFRTTLRPARPPLNDLMRRFDVDLVGRLVEDLQRTELGSTEIDRAEEFGSPDSDSDFGADFLEGLSDGSGGESEDSTAMEGEILERRAERLERFVGDEVGWMSRYRRSKLDFVEVSDGESDC